MDTTENRKQKTYGRLHSIMRRGCLRWPTVTEPVEVRLKPPPRQVKPAELEPAEVGAIGEKH